MKVMHAQRQAGVAGSERYLLSILPALARRGIDTSYMMFRAAAPTPALLDFATQLRDEGVKVHEIDATRGLSFALLSRFKAVLELEKVEVLQTNLLHADVYGALVKRLMKHPPILVSAKHGYSEVYQVKNGFEPAGLRWDVYSLASRFAALNADAVFAISRGLHRLHGEGGLVAKEKLHLIPYGFDFHDETSRGSAGAFRVAPLQILALSRLVPYKQIDVLIDALPALLPKYPGLKLVLVGDGPLRESLAELAQRNGVGDSVVFAGFQNNVHDYIRDSDVFALPSLVEGFGRVILEAWSHGKPVVCFDVPAPNEIVTNARDGLMAPPGDREAFVRALDRLLADPAERSRIGANARKTYERQYTLDLMLDRTIALYERALTAHGPSHDGKGVSGAFSH